MKKIFYYLLVTFLFIIPLLTNAETAEKDARSFSLAILLVLISSLFFTTDAYIILDKIFSLFFKGKHFDPFFGVTSWKDYYQHLYGNIILYIIMTFLRVAVLALIVLFIIQPLFLLILIPYIVIPLTAPSLENLILITTGIVAFLLSIWIGIILIKKFTNCSFKQALKGYLVKLIPIIVFVLLWFVISGFFHNDKLNIKNTNSTNISNINSINATVNTSTNLLSDFECQQYDINQCPDKCTVCPPCEVCSSLKCRSIISCDDIGFDKNWYKNLNIK